MNVAQVQIKKLLLAKEKILSGLDRLTGRRVLIVGDLGLDQYVLGQVRRISPEAPVPVLEVEKEDQRLGLATNVAQNVASLGGTPLLVGVIGADQAAEELKTLLSEANVSTEHLIVDSSRPTTRKLRVMAEHHHLARVDYEHRQFLSTEVEDRLLAKVEALLELAEVVALEDYAKGVVSERCVQKIIQLCSQAGKPVMIDPHRQTPPFYYRGADLMTPNRDEAYDLSGLDFDDLREKPDSLIEVGQALVDKLGLKNLVITEGKKGMSLFEGKRVVQLPTCARQVFDVTGAGDTVIAALALAWASGFSLAEASTLANFAAGVVVEKVGCVPCTQEELTSYINELVSEPIL